MNKLCLIDRIQNHILEGNILDMPKIKRLFELLEAELNLSTFQNVSHKE